MAKISLFDPENNFWSFLTRIYNLAFAGVLWFLTSIPLITIGASTTALYTYAFSVTEQRDGYVSRTFFSSFKKNFIKATVIWIGMVLMFAFLFLDGYLASTGLTKFSHYMFFLVLAFAIIVAVIAVHVFPLLATCDLSYKEMGKRIVLLGLGNLPISVTLVVVNLLFFLAIYAFPPAVFFFQGFVAALCTLFLKSAYNRIPNLCE